MKIFKVTMHYISVIAFLFASSAALAASKAWFPSVPTKSAEPDQPPTQMFWHENRLNAQSFCSSTFINNLLMTGDFWQVGNRHPEDVLQPIMRQKYFWYTAHANLAKDIIAYDPSGNCRLVDGKRKGSLTFGAQPEDDGVGAGLYVFTTIEDKAILSTSYFAISADPSRGPWIKSKVNYAYNNSLPGHISFPNSERYFDIEIRYLDNEGAWTTISRDRITNGSTREARGQYQLPYDTLVELRIVSPFESFSVPVDHELHNLYGDYIFPSIYDFSLQTETCVPDLISGECLE